MPIAVTVGFGTAFGQTLANGGSFEQAFAAGVIGGVMGGVGAYGMGIVGAYVASFGNPLLSYALAAVALAGGTYQTVESFRSGQYVAGAVGAVFVAFRVASLLASSSRAAQGSGTDNQNGLKAGEGAQGVQLADAREGVVLNDASGPGAQDIELLARVTYAEAAGQHNVPGAMEGVAWTVRNRVESPLFPDTYEDVVLQKNQFASVGGKLWRQAGNPTALRGPSLTAYNRALAVARSVYAGTVPDPTRGALYFHSGVPTPWFQGAMQAGRIQATLVVPPPPQARLFTFYR